MLEKAIHIAVKAHSGQVDKGGQPYILHPLRVMLSCETELEKICAVLHDVVEDTDITVDDLRIEGFTDEVLEAIDRLTKRENEEYALFITRISKNKLASRVKLADINDNLNLDRIPDPSLVDNRRVEKYKDAYQKLYATLYSDNNDSEDDYEIKIDGCVTLPKAVTEETFTNIFIDFIEANHWYFGGSINAFEEEA